VKNDGDPLIPLTAARDELEAGIWRDILERDGSLRLFVQAADERRARWLLGERIRSA
jgi:hypothetical protein